jgi:hypothetical protein
VQCFDVSGRLKQAFVLTNFDPAELREAFDEAGLRVA